jgi:hypothetical protein
VTNLLKSNSEKIIEGLERNPGLRLVLGLIPFAPGVLDMFVAHGKNLQEARIKALFGHLEQNHFILTDKLVQDEDFLHHCLVTMKAAARTKRKEKIALMANALINSTKAEFGLTDFEEHFDVVDELSLREFQALYILAEYESKFPEVAGENRLQRAKKFWDEFLQELNSKIGVEPVRGRDFLKRIERTGCYSEFTGSYWGYSGGIGYLTQTYFEIAKLVAADPQSGGL